MRCSWGRGPPTGRRWRSRCASATTSNRVLGEKEETGGRAARFPSSATWCQGIYTQGPRGRRRRSPRRWSGGGSRDYVAGAAAEDTEVCGGGAETAPGLRARGPSRAPHAGARAHARDRGADISPCSFDPRAPRPALPASIIAACRWARSSASRRPARAASTACLPSWPRRRARDSHGARTHAREVVGVHENLAHLARHHAVDARSRAQVLAEDRPKLPRYAAEEDAGVAGLEAALPPDDILGRLSAALNLEAELTTLVGGLTGHAARCLPRGSTSRSARWPCLSGSSSSSSTRRIASLCRHEALAGRGGE